MFWDQSSPSSDSAPSRKGCRSIALISYAELHILDPFKTYLHQMTRVSTLPTGRDANSTHPCTTPSLADGELTLLPAK